MLLLSGLILVISVIFGVVYASTEVTGIISSDTTWTKANSPYSLTGPLLVNEGVTLTIETGTTVDINGYYILVNGTLFARGSIGDVIQFNNGKIRFSDSSIDWNEQTGSGGIIENAVLNNMLITMNVASPLIMGNSINGSIEGQYCSSVISSNIMNGEIDFSSAASCIISNNTITHADKAITLRASSNQAILSGNNISYCQTGISVTSHGTVIDTTISNCNTGISIGYYKNPTIERNLITDNTVGVHIYRNALLAQGTPVVRNNTITKNSLGVSIEHFQSQDYVVAAKFEYNNIYGNDYNLKSTVSNTIDATYNWWGTTDTESINQTINDVTLDFTGGTVNFVPFLTEPNTEAMPIPEFTSWIILPLLMMVTLLVIVFKKKVFRSIQD